VQGSPTDCDVSSECDREARKGKAVTRNRVETLAAHTNMAANGKCEPERSVSLFKRHSTPITRHADVRRLVKIVP
jgi:hypothetical protein